MDDIKIPDDAVGQGKTQGDDRGDGHDDDFRVQDISAEPLGDSDEIGEMVRVKFEKFVQLVATHDFEEVMAKHDDEDVIVSTNLLADLANAHEEGMDGGRKLPVIFLIGVILGIVVTYLLVTY